MAPPIEISIDDSDPDQQVLVLRGELDYRAREALVRAVGAMEGPAVHVDLALVSFADATGAAAIAAAREGLELTGRRLVLRNVRDDLGSLLAPLPTGEDPGGAPSPEAPRPARARAPRPKPTRFGGETAPSGYLPAGGVVAFQGEATIPFQLSLWVPDEDSTATISVFVPAELGEAEPDLAWVPAAGVEVPGGHMVPADRWANRIEPDGRPVGR